MPASYTIDIERKAIFSTATGTLTDADLRDHQRHVLRDPDFDPGLRQLWDLREVSATEVSTETLRDLAASTSYAPETKRAVVAPRDVIYGLARMFQTLHEHAGEDFRVFRSADEAREWLGLQPAA